MQEISWNLKEFFRNTFPMRGGRQTKDCSQTWSFGFQFRLGKHFSDERGLAFYYLKIGFLEYLQISGEMRYPNAPIGYWRKEKILKEASVVQVGAVMHDYQGEEAIRSKKCLWWKDCPGAWAQLGTDNVNFCTRSRPYQREASRPSGPGQVFFRFFQPASHPSSRSIFSEFFCCIVCTKQPRMNESFRDSNLNFGEFTNPLKFHV